MGRSDKPSPTHPNDQIHHSTKLHKLRPLPLPEPGKALLPHFGGWKLGDVRRDREACAPCAAPVSLNFKPLLSAAEGLCAGGEGSQPGWLWPGEAAGAPGSAAGRRGSRAGGPVRPEPRARQDG